MMENDTGTGNLELKPETLNYLNTTRRWTMFLSILGFIGLGTFLISGLIAGVFLSIFETSQIGLPEWLILTLFPVIGLITFFPLLFLFRFSKQMGQAVKAGGQQELHKAFRNLKSYYVYTGIMVILILAFYAIVFIAAGSSLAFLGNQ